MLSAFDIYNIASLRTYIWQIKQYRIWYRKYCGLEEEKGFNLSPAMVDIAPAVKAALYSGEEELIDILSVLPIDQGYFEHPVVWLTWLGLTLKEITELKDEDIFFDNQSVFIKVGDSVRVSRNNNIFNILSTYRNTKIGVRTHIQDYYVYPVKSSFLSRGFILKSIKIKTS